MPPLGLHIKHQHCVRLTFHFLTQKVYGSLPLSMDQLCHFAAKFQNMCSQVCSHVTLTFHLIPKVDGFITITHTTFSNLQQTWVIHLQNILFTSFVMD